MGVSTGSVGVTKLTSNTKRWIVVEINNVDLHSGLDLRTKVILVGPSQIVNKHAQRDLVDILEIRWLVYGHPPGGVLHLEKPSSCVRLHVVPGGGLSSVGLIVVQCCQGYDEGS